MNYMDIAQFRDSYGKYMPQGIPSVIMPIPTEELEDTSEPIEEVEEEPVEEDTPEQVEDDTPETLEEDNPEQVEEVIDEPVEEDTPEQVEEVIDEPEALPDTESEQNE